MASRPGLIPADRRAVPSVGSRSLFASSAAGPTSPSSPTAAARGATRSPTERKPRVPGASGHEPWPLLRRRAHTHTHTHTHIQGYDAARIPTTPAVTAGATIASSFSPPTSFTGTFLLLLPFRRRLLLLLLPLHDYRFRNSHSPSTTPESFSSSTTCRDPPRLYPQPGTAQHAPAPSSLELPPAELLTTR